MHSRHDRPMIAFGSPAVQMRPRTGYLFQVLAHPFNAPTKHFGPDEGVVVYERLWRLCRPLLHWETGTVLRSQPQPMGGKTSRVATRADPTLHFHYRAMGSNCPWNPVRFKQIKRRTTVPVHDHPLSRSTPITRSVNLRWTIWSIQSYRSLPAGSWHRCLAVVVKSRLVNYRAP